MVSLHERAKLHVISFASRTRHPLLVVKVAGEWHTKQQWASVNPCERAQEQFQIGPARRGIYAVLKFHVTATRGYFFVPTRSLVTLPASVVLVPLTLAISFGQSGSSGWHCGA